MTALRESFMRDNRWVKVIMLVAWAWGFVAKRIVLGVIGCPYFCPCSCSCVGCGCCCGCCSWTGPLSGCTRAFGMLGSR